MQPIMAKHSQCETPVLGAKEKKVQNFLKIKIQKYDLM